MSKDMVVIICFVSIKYVIIFVFFLMIRRPPRSTLFPYTDALPISLRREGRDLRSAPGELDRQHRDCKRHLRLLDRKSTRLNSSHPSISYAVFCLKKKKTRLRANDGSCLWHA